MNAKISEFVIWRPSNLHTFCVFFILFFFFFLNHTSRTHRSLMAIFTHFGENPSIKCSSNYYIVFSKPCHTCRHSFKQQSNQIDWRNMKTQRAKAESYFMITQTRLKQQKKIQLVFIDHKLCHIFDWSNLQQIICIGTLLTLRAIFQEIDEQLETKCAR